MRKLTLLSLFISFFTLFLFFSRANPIYAQQCGEACGAGNTCTSPLSCVSGVCTSTTQCPACTDGGRSGACTASMACPQGLQNQGTCSDVNTICCVPQPTQGGTGTCGVKCTAQAQCASSFTCTNGFCIDSTQCPACTGTSGFKGSCLDAGVCNGIGMNSNDGACNLPGGGGVCCTNAPTGNTCSLAAVGPAISQAATQMQFTSNTPNKLFYFTYVTTVTGGTCTTGGQRTTDANGSVNFAVVCSPSGQFTINASTSPAGSPLCSTTLDVTGGPTTAPPDVNSPLGGICGPSQLDTAIGCIEVGDTNSVISFLIPWSMGIAGGIALILIIYAGFMITTSSGDPRRLAAGKELLTAAISGLILLIFAVFLLRVIGKNILNVPGLSQ